MPLNNLLAVLRSVKVNEFSMNEYEANPQLTFVIEFVSPRTVHLRAKSELEVTKENESFSLKAVLYSGAINFKIIQ